MKDCCFCHCLSRNLTEDEYYCDKCGAEYIKSSDFNEDLDFGEDLDWGYLEDDDRYWDCNN